MMEKLRWSFSLALAAALLSCGGGDDAGQPAAQDDPSRSASTLPIPGSEGGATGGNLPEGHPPIGDAPQLPPVQGVGGMEWDAPEDWTAETPSSNMRQAQYRVPGPAGDAECVVFYFGAAQGGDAQANALRWAGQFSQPDGSSSVETMKTDTFNVGDIEVLIVEVTGTYDGGMTMSTAPPEPQPNAMLLGAVAEGPDAPWFFKFTGPEETVRANREAFERMLRSLRTSS